MALADCFILFAFLCLCVKGQTVDNYVPNIDPDSCNTPSSDGFSQFFDSATMSCQKCSQNSTFQYSNLYNCYCNPGYKYATNFGGTRVTCQPCGRNEVVSSDGWECKLCAGGSNNSTCKCDVASGSITVERNLDGRWYYTNPNKDECVSCATGSNTLPNADGNQCVRCTDDLKMTNSCQPNCPATQKAGAFCFSSSSDLLPDTGNTLHQIPRIDGTDSIVSAYFTENLRAAYALCTNQQYGNVTACQQVANLCTLIMYNQRAGRICEKITQIMPNLYRLLYYTDDPEDVIGSTVIQDSYTLTPPKTIPFWAVVHSLEGKYLRRVALTDGLLQLCSTTEDIANAAYTFGTYYSYSCTIKALGLWDKVKHPLEFFDIYLEYTENSQKRLFKVPLRFLDLRDNGDKTPNTGAMTDWILTRRMFLVDNVINKESTAGTTNTKYVRYLQSVTLNIELQEDTKDGKIKIPYLTLKYADVSYETAAAGGTVKISFSTTYSMSWSSYRKDFQIAVGTLGCFAALFAGYRTWVWSKRAGRISIDFPSIINFLFYAAAALSNIFYVITFGIAFYWFIFFKRQDYVYLVHPEGMVVEEWLALLGAAFALRALSIIHMIVMQCSADIFLIDWERPKGISKAQDGKKSSEVPVSIWRTYFVANEWNEIQTLRKVRPKLQIFAVLFFLLVIKFVDTTTKDPNGTVNKNSSIYQAEQSFIYRYALGALVWMLVAIVQWIFTTFIYERFVEDKIQQFVDLCSMSNISVFIMANANFGYYIHGRSVHGKADTDMREMAEMMKREEEDLCGKRGLVPDTEEQTFMMSLPKRLRIKYEQVYLPAALENAGAQTRMEQGKTGRSSGKEKSIEAYAMLNKFLCGFIDHALRDVDYVVKDKTLLESIMDTEFFDATNQGIFYKDNGHSFDQVLFYGNEMSLCLFEILLFSVVDLIWRDYLLDGIIVYLVSCLVSTIRDTAARQNLARKTLVDKRFLI